MMLRTSKDSHVRRLGAWAALAVAGGSAFAASRATDGIELRFVRSETLHAKFEHVESQALNLDRLALLRAGKDPVVSEVDMKVLSGARVEVTEGFDSATGNLRRQYGPIEGTLRAAVMDGDEVVGGSETELDSPLPDIGVAFVPAAGAPGGFARHFDTVKTLAESRLPQLELPQDWGRILPKDEAGQPKAVVAGEEWKVDARDLEVVFAPAGDLMLRGGAEADPRIMRAHRAGLGGNLHFAFSGDVGGTAVAKVTEQGFNDEDGRYADILLEFDLSLSADRSDLAERRRLTEQGEDGLEVRGARLDLNVDGATNVRWSLDTNGPIRFVTESKEKARVAVRLSDSSGEETQQVVEMSGDLLLGTRFLGVTPLSSARKR